MFVSKCLGCPLIAAAVIGLKVTKSFESFEKVPKGSFNPLIKGFFQRILKDFKGFTLWVRLSIAFLSYIIIFVMNCY